MIDTFTRSDFESALPAGYHCLGYEHGELTYRIPTVGAVEIVIRSSIREDGQSAGVGEDSIRAWLVSAATGAPVSNKTQQYITRVSGWQGRLQKSISTLTTWRRTAGDCPKCGEPKGIFKSTTPKNPGRIFAKCWVHSDTSFEWLDAPRSKPYYANVSTKTPVPTEADNSKVNPTIEKTMGGLSVSVGTGVTLLDMPATKADVSPVSSLISPASPTSPVSPLSFLSNRAATRIVSEPEIDPVAAQEFVPSRYQSAVYDFIRNESGNAVVVASPGSGKTSLLKHAAPHLPTGARIAAIAFGKHNAADLQRALPDVQASTFHSLGLSNVKRAMPKCVVDTDKTWKLLRGIENRGGPLAEIVSEDGAEIKHLVELVKSTMAEYDDDSLARICDRYGITLNGNSDGAYAIARQVLETSEADTSTADFGDMLRWCVIGKVKSQKFDFVLQDEAQDAGQAQIDFVKVSLAPGGRLIAVGDPRQAIFGWAGSATDSLEQVTRHHHAVNLPLSISYRLPASHVDFINRKFPGANIEARPGASEGVIANRSYAEMVGQLGDGDMVIARVNSVLVEPCFEMIRMGKKAVIMGRDVSKNLSALLNKIEKKNAGADLKRILSALRYYSSNEYSKLIAAQRNNQAATLLDTVETIYALADGCYTVGDVRKKINQVFSDDAQGIMFSSVHRAKGKESNRVYILNPELMPHRLAVEPWQLQAEDNILFVALSRSKNGLYFTSGIDKRDNSVVL